MCTTPARKKLMKMRLNVHKSMENYYGVDALTRKSVFGL